ncbi:hypothetical protein [Janibacter sp. LM]|uniref:hypothetical protein n=1 Tax=Janibacter sp. LM TaxID=3144845 RepID=UPI0031F639E3
MKTVPIRHVADVWTSSVDKHAIEGELPVQLCNYTDAYKKDRVRPGPDLMRATATAEEIRKNRLQVGDSVFTKDSEDPKDIGVSAFVDGEADDFVCGYHLAIARPFSVTHGRFLNWALRSRPVLEHFSNHAAGISRYGIGLSGLRSAPIPLVTQNEQRRIADFLDDRVSRIDRIIAARREQMELAVEEAAASLDDLVGQSPAQSRRPLQALTNPARPIQYGIVLPGPHYPGGVPIIKGGDIGSGRLARLELNQTDPKIEAAYARSRVQPGDFVIAIRGSVGEVASVPKELRQANLTQDSARIATWNCDRDWLRAALEAPSVQSEIAQRVTGATIRGINIGDLRRVPLPVPSGAEQRRIGQAARTVKERSKGHQSALRQSLVLLTEYKSSLITAAVTGELDVSTAGSSIPG